MKRYILLLTLSVCVAAAQAAAPKRPMLEQGKTWVYVYHQVTDETIGDVPLWWIYYRLNGDTIIDGRQYMKMYRSDWDNNLNEYYGAYREDEEGRVYLYSRYNKEEYKVFDLEWADFEYHPDNIIIEAIKSNGKLFNRYRYQSRHPEGDTYDVYCSIEGVGYKDCGIIHLPWDTPDCPEDYEELYEVFSKDFFFSASDFNAPKEIELTEGEQELINSNNDFAFNLFRKARGEKSKILSPLSITFALGMLNNGADGETLKQINQTLGFGDAGADAINVFCQKMLKESNTLDEKTKAMIANTIFVNEGFGYRLQEDFIDKANTFYDAQPQNRDFADGETMDVINQWASDHTMGMIPEVLKEDSFNPDAVSYLLNALYFKGIWSSPFKKEETQDESFGGGDEVPMMHQFKEGLLYTENDLYQAVRLPYGNGAYRMDVFLPREDKTVGEVLETLSGSNWQPEYENTDVDLKLPRFETDTNQDLVGVMAGLGMPKAFSINAEFPYFCNGDPYISQMFQVAKIKLDEEGTEAAAVTVIEMTESIPQRADFHANRPFLYIISEQSTGVIFFIGQYTGGVTADIRTGIVGTKAEPRTGANDLIYILSGQRLSQEPARGLYIKNGKVMIK
jgi:serpin B